MRETRALDRIAQDCAGEAKRALEGARALLCEQLESMGVPVPQRRRKRQEAA